MTTDNENTEALRDAIVHELDDWPPARVFIGGGALTTDQPAWATDPRGLPPAVQNRSGRTWGRSGETSYAGFTPTELEALHGPLTPLWPETPPASPLPDLSRWHPVPVGATIPRGTLYATYYSDERMGLCVSDHDSVAWMGHYYTEHPIPDPDEPTDAEVEAFKRAWESTPAGEPGARTRAGLRAAAEARQGDHHA